MLGIIRNNLLPCTINVITVIYLLSRILKIKVGFNNYKSHILFILLIIFSIVNFIYIDNFIRFITSTLYTIICVKIVYKEQIHKVAAAVIIQQVILFISELIYALIVIFIFEIGNLNSSESIIGALIPNLLICLFAILLINTKFILNFFDKIMEFMEKIKQKNKYILTFVLMITLNILLAIMYLNSDNLLMVGINVIFILVYSYIVYLLLNEKHLNVKVKEENKLLLENLNDYEKMLDYQRVANHENKNQLLVIKTMVNKNNKKLHEFLDEIIKEKREDNESLYNSAKRIPSGGLQGLVYQKMLVMQDKNINIDLNISNEVRKIKLSKLDAKTNFDLLRVVGIIIDNAIDETSKLKEKEISVSMYKDDNNLIIDIANKCKNIPDLEKIDEKGYTTKEKGHGYGLSLLKDICDKNSKIKNERKIIGNIFFQIIKIKL